MRKDLPKPGRTQRPQKRAKTAKKVSATAPSASSFPTGPAATGSQSSRTAVGETGRRKRRIEESDDDELQADDPSPRKKHRSYVYLEPTTRRIPQETIANGWKSAPPPAQEEIRTVLATARRSVLNRCKDAKRRQEVEQALNPLLRRLERQLPRMPFPPKTTECHFNMDKLLAKSRRVENELTPIVHSVELIEAAIETELVELEVERRELEQLKKRAKAERKRQQKQAELTIHPLLQGFQPDDNLCDDARSIGLVANSPAVDIILEGQDPDIQPLVAQFSQHLVTMRANLAQVGNLDEAIDTTSRGLARIVQHEDG